MLADQLGHYIIEKVKAAKWFTVIAEEVTDVANREQLSIDVDSTTLTVREDLVGFFESDTGISGLEESVSPPWASAGNMAGAVNSTTSLIFKKYPLALYLS